MDKYFFRVSANDFAKIPASPLSYWLGDKAFDAFKKSKNLGSFARAAKGLVTANNQEFVRQWSEISFDHFGLECKSREEGVVSEKRWFPYAKGGEFRRWYGNLEAVVDWESDGLKIQTTLTVDGSRPPFSHTGTSIKSRAMRVSTAEP